jgi:[acyl-carrier-protein] S-malonyltransferase
VSSNKRAFIFPGQGSQYVGMAKDLYEASPTAKNLLERFEKTAGFSLLRVMFEGPEEELRRTENAQPAIVAHSLTALALIREAGIDADMTAGHSLGEYSALVAAGVLEAEEAIRVVRMRGLLMGRAEKEKAGAMAAVIGLEQTTLEGIVEDIGEGSVVIANYNCPGQLVISGGRDAVAQASLAAKQAGARAVIPLQVSGAFHSPLVASIADEFAAYLETVAFAKASMPVYCNIDAQPRVDFAELRTCLQRQVTSPVLWEATIRRMIADGVREFIEIGPKDVLTKMIFRIDASVKAWAVGKWQDLHKLL